MIHVFKAMPFNCKRYKVQKLDIELKNERELKELEDRLKKKYSLKFNTKIKRVDFGYTTVINESDMLNFIEDKFRGKRIDDNEWVSGDLVSCINNDSGKIESSIRNKNDTYLIH